MKRIFLFAGEQSGDQHGANLIIALKKESDAILEGCGGPAMRNAGLHSLFAMEDFEVMGFQDTLLSLPKLWKQFRLVQNAILTGNYDAVVFIDYPGFNLRMCSSIRKRGYPGKTIQYVSPGVWAWGKSRIATMEKYLSHLMTIYPFESKYFEGTSLPVTYVGNPCATTIRNYSYQNHWKQDTRIGSEQEILSIFPGSRKKEVQKNLAKHLLAAAKLQKERTDIHVAISSARDELVPYIQSAIDTTKVSATIVSGKYRFEMMRDAKIAIAASGTVTLELALHQTPTVVTYEVSSFNRFFIKYWIRPTVNHYCIVNILGKKEIFPEYIEKKYTPDQLAKTLMELDSDPILRENVSANCSKIQELLGNQNSHEIAAKTILYRT